MQRVFHSCFIAILLILMTTLPSYAQEWMGLEPTSSTTIGLQSSIDKNNNRDRTLSVFTTLGEYFSFNLDITKNTLIDEIQTLESELFFYQFSWLVTDEIELRIAQQFEGEKQELESNKTQIQFDYSPYPLSISLIYSEGDVTIYTQQNPFAIRPTRSSINSDFTVSGLSISWWFDEFTLSVSQTLYDYEKDISLLSSRPVLQLIIKHEAFLHSAILLLNEQKMSIQIPFESRSFTLHYISITSAVDLSTIKIARADWFESISSDIQFISSISQTLIEEGAWSLSLGIEWTF